MSTAIAPAHFFAVVDTPVLDGGRTRHGNLEFYSVPLDQTLAEQLSSAFETMSRSFFDDHQTIIDFDGRYTPGRDEMFLIKEFSIDSSLLKYAKNPLLAPTLSLDGKAFPLIKAIVCTRYNGAVTAYFQEFRASQIIRQGFALLHLILNGKSTYTKVDKSGIAIGNDIDAVYENGQLYFRSYYTANRFTDLSVYFKEATNQDIKGLFALEGIVAEDEDAFLGFADTAMRRKITIIKQTGILDKIDPDQVQKVAEKLDIEVIITGLPGERQVVIPGEKKAARDVLDLLTESVFPGALTGELFIANSYRPKHKVGSKDGSKTSKAASNADGAQAKKKATVKKSSAKKASKKAAAK